MCGSRGSQKIKKLYHCGAERQLFLSGSFTLGRRPEGTIAAPLITGYHSQHQTSDMANLPPAMNFAEVEESTVKKWKEDNTFKVQDKLSLERGDPVSRLSPRVFYQFPFRRRIYCLPGRF